LDSYLWIVIAPSIALVYLLFVRGGIYTARISTHNKLDILMFILVLWGVLTILLGVAVNGSPTFYAKIFVHAYFPVVFYFLIRSYTMFSLNRIAKALNLIWIVFLIVIVDAIVEVYIINIYKAPEYIPWVMASIDNVLAIQGYGKIHDPALPLHVISVFSSNKVLSFLVSAMACFIVGYVINARHESNSKNYIIFERSLLLNLILLLSLIVVSINLSSFASSVSLFFTVFILILIANNKNGWLLFVATAICFYTISFLNQYVVTAYEYKVLTVAPGVEKSAIETIFNFKAVLSEYSHNLLELLFGSVVTDVYNSVRGGSQSELRLFAYPVYYGVVWGVVMLMIVWNLLRDSKWIMYHNGICGRYKALGLSFMGFFIIYIFDVHYPSFDRHGPYELFFIMAGILSSLHEIKRYNN